MGQMSYCQGPSQPLPDSRIMTFRLVGVHPKLWGGSAASGGDGGLLHDTQLLAPLLFFFSLLPSLASPPLPSPTSSFFRKLRSSVWSLSHTHTEFTHTPSVYHIRLCYLTKSELKRAEVSPAILVIGLPAHLQYTFKCFHDVSIRHVWPPPSK